jgi:PAS domain-containing protein
MDTSTHKTSTNVISILVLVVVLGIGIWSTVYVGNKIDATEREGLLLRAGTIARTIDQQALSELSGDESDITKPSYRKLKTIMEDVHKLNTDTRFVYLMGLEDGKQFFYVDSEDPASEDYSPPGQAYEDATPTDISNHENAVAYTNGPYSDQWGTWISAYAPIVNKDTGEVLALVGMDVDAENILSQIWLAQEVVIAISLLVLLSTILLIMLIRRSNAYTDKLEKVNQDLSLDKDYMLEVEHIARLGQVTWNSVAKDVVINQIVMDLIGIKQSKVPLGALLEHIDQNDVARMKKEIEALPTNTSFITLRYRVISPDNEEHTMVSLCKMKRDSKGNILRVVCTAQDIGGSAKSL